jgi:large subunit ribosomal protein L24
MNKKFKLRRGDPVIVTSGKNKNQKGQIIKILYKTDMVLIKGVNIVKRHLKPSVKHPEGTLSKEMPIHISNIAYFDTQNDKKTKIKYEIIENVKKRIAKSSGKVIDS